eukprot:COSAG06_NODE_11516_length_1498_cov_7.656183_2_plen_97_part_00
MQPHHTSATAAEPGTACVSDARLANAAEMVHPPWDMVVKQQGYTCVDASLDHDPFTENNTRCVSDTHALCLLSAPSQSAGHQSSAAWPEPVREWTS